MTLGTDVGINITTFYAVSDTWYRGRIATFYAVIDTWNRRSDQYSYVLCS